MREIKFRAWDKRIKEYKHPKLWDNSMPSNWGYWYELEQYTGLKDCNGREIFEGDRVNVKYNNIGVITVAFNNGAYNVADYNLSRCEVVGTIHDKEVGDNGI